MVFWVAFTMAFGCISFVILHSHQIYNVRSSGHARSSGSFSFLFSFLQQALYPFAVIPGFHSLLEWTFTMVHYQGEPNSKVESLPSPSFHPWLLPVLCSPLPLITFAWGVFLKSRSRGQSAFSCWKLSLQWLLAKRNLSFTAAASTPPSLPFPWCCGQ